MEPIWIQLYYFPLEYWKEYILEDLGNTLGIFLQASKKIRKMTYKSYSHIHVYMDISKYLLEGIKLSWEDEEWFQPLDYEHIPFRCR
jgi:hypothetical protein